MGSAPHHSPAAPRVPLSAVVLIAAASFLVGHYSSPSPAAAAKSRHQQTAAPVAGSSSSSSSSAAAAAASAAASAAPPALRDMGVIANEWLEASGLLKARPPLEPAPSGNAHYTVAPFQVISWYPRIVVYPNFVDPARCDAVVRLARTKLMASDVAWRPDEKPDPSQEMRTSDGAFLDASEDKDGVLAWLERKIAAVTMLPVSHGEAFNVLRYRNGAHYDSHMDTFDPKEFGAQASQRVATVLLYLSDVEEGGETVFKREGKGNAGLAVYDYKSCDSGYRYRPRKGDAVLFYSLTPDGTIDPRSLHGGCPVKKGEKWVATKWIHDKPFPGRYDEML